MAKEIRPLQRYNEDTEQTEIFYPATTTDAIADVDREQSLTETLEDTAFVGEVVGDPTGEWNKGEAEDYIDKEIAKVKNWVSNTPVTNVVTVSSLPASGNVNTLYRVAGTNTYSEYGWDGTQFVKLDEKEYGIDAEPTAGSNNLVKSGGVAEELALGAVYDVSAKNPTAGTNNDGKWESLSALLSNANLNTLIPTSVRKGGMSVKFVLTSSNKYVQYRYTNTDAATNSKFVNAANWQGVDEEPTAGSENLVKSGRVSGRVIDTSFFVSGYYSGYNKHVGDIANTSLSSGDAKRSFKFSVNKDEVLFIYTYSSSDVSGYVRPLILTDKDNIITYIAPPDSVMDYTAEPLIVKSPSDGFAYIECDADKLASFIGIVSMRNQNDYYIKFLNDRIPFVNSSLKAILGNEGYKNIVQTGKFLATGDVGGTAATTETSNAAFGYVKENCSVGDVYLICVKGGKNGRAYAFCDENNVILESAPAYAGIYALITAPSNTSYVIINNSFSTLNGEPNPLIYKMTNGALESLLFNLNALDKKIDSLIQDKALQYTSYITGYFINTSGNNAKTSAGNRQINTYDVIPGKYRINRLQGNNFTRGWRLKNSQGTVLELGPIGGTEMLVEEYIDVNVVGTLDVFFLSTSPCTVTLISELSKALEPVYDEINDCNKKATNVGGLYLANNKILLCGASISTVKNAYFEYAMKVLGINGLNISNAGTNIYYLAYKLYSNANAYVDYDVLIISHIHNFNVYDLPSGKATYSVSDYENDSFLGDYIKTTSHYSGNLTAEGGYTADELYAMGYDYVLKKWAKLCYDMKNTEGYNSVFGKPCQVVLYTYWHDARVSYNTSIRKLAKKWGFILIKDDENIGFSKSQVNPATNQQWSRLYGDTTGWQATEVINGVIYGLHPDRMTDANYQAWQNSGILLQSYLPYIQKIRSAILVNTLKDAIIKPE